VRALLPVQVDGDLDHEERAGLIQTIEDGAADIARGGRVDGMEFDEQFLARREAASR
jgi:hypothetical protein